MSSKGWVGFDLDGTLAHYDGWHGVEHIGAPIMPMVEKLKAVLAEGKYGVRIFTARVCVSTQDTDPDHYRNWREAEDARLYIERWCAEHIGKVLPVTNVKDFGMVLLYDDRAIQVEANTGREIVDSGVPCPECGKEAVCRATQGEVSWLHCFACKTNFDPVDKL